MNPHLKEPAAAAANPVELETTGPVIPIWLILVTALMMFLGAVYFDHHSGWFNTKVYAPYRSINEVIDFQPPTGAVDINVGRKKYEDVCAICHGSDGKGKPGQAPPLAGSEWVTSAGFNRLVRIPVLGMNGPIEVSGQTYTFPSGGMTAVAPQSSRASGFTDEMLANVLSYIRQAWGNQAGPVTAADVKVIRDDIGDRATAMTVEETLRLPEEFKK